jgi:hypothetical protein
MIGHTSYLYGMALVALEYTAYIGIEFMGMFGQNRNIIPLDMEDDVGV